MIEIRFHGRGGQGAVTAASLLAEAAILEGKYAQSFPAFGPERRGAPVLAFTRISDKLIEIRSQVYNPDIIVVLDSSLLKTVNVTAGLKKNGIMVLNMKYPPKEYIGKGFKIAYADATDIALKYIKMPITNTAMLGALLKATEIVSLNSMTKIVGDKFGESNVNALIETYKITEVI